MIDENIETILDKVKHGIMPTSIPSVDQHKAVEILKHRIALTKLSGQELPKNLLGVLSLIVTSAIGQLSTLDVKLTVPRGLGIVPTLENERKARLTIACASIGVVESDLNNRIEFCNKIVKELKPLLLTLKAD